MWFFVPYLGTVGLNARQKIFVKEYLIDKNATRAAAAAGYSPKTARVIGGENLTKPAIRKAIDAEINKHVRRLDITADRVMNRIAEYAFDKKSIKPSDVLKANEMLAKHFKLLTDVHEVAGKGGEPLVILTMPANGREAPKEELKDEDKPVGSD